VALRPILYITGQTISYSSIATLFLLVRFHSVLSYKGLTMVLAYLMVNLSWAVLLMIFATLFKNSNKVLNSWRFHFWTSAKERKFMLKFKRSCRPLSAYCGDFYPITFKKVGASCNFVFWGLTRCIIIFGK
jgi:hypothetical protein